MSFTPSSRATAPEASLIDLPQEFQVLLVEQLDEYLESAEGSTDAATMVQDLLELLQTVADQSEADVPGKDIVAYIENESELDDGLFDLLLEEFEEEDLEDFTGEGLLAIFEKIVEVEWIDEDEGSLGVEELDEELGFEDAVLTDLDDDY